MGVLESFGSNLTSSLTGSIDKALLCIKKVEQQSGGTAGKKKLSNVDLQAKLAAESGKGFLSGRAFVQSTIQENGGGFHVLQVKYNPSKIRLFSQGGSFMQPGVGGEGVNTLSQITIPAQTYMVVELLFDDENHQDAFMWEKFTNLSAGALVSDISGLMKMNEGEFYSVQPQIDALIGMITQSETRKVVFYWSDMVFAGEITNINARYTMFNQRGNPIRGSVELMIRQGGQDDDNSGDQAYWNQAFDALFKSDMNSGRSITDKAGSILNLK